MHNSSRIPVDPVEELRLRCWARENYVSADHRDSGWHAVVLDEMQKKDQELAPASPYGEMSWRAVPLTPEQGFLRGPHVEPSRSSVLLRLPALE
jgi:hypothetical protein